jgi:hypothetical protein
MIMTSTWRKSTHSAVGNCVETGTWRKASYSGPTGGNCVEAGTGPSVVGVRDTQQEGAGPVLEFSPRAWAAFTRSLTAA